MSGLQLSASTRALLEAAKSDAPAAAARAKIWVGVATAAGLGGAAAATTSMAPSLAGGTVSASKLIAMGALLGSAVTVGVTLALLRVMNPAPTSAPGTTIAVAANLADVPNARSVSAGQPPRSGAGSALVPGDVPNAGQAVLPLETANAAANAAPASQGASMGAWAGASVASNVRQATGPAGTPSQASQGQASQGQASQGQASQGQASQGHASQDRGGPAPGPAAVAGPADLSASMAANGPRAGRVHVLTASPRGSVGRASATQAVEDPLMHEAALVAEARGSLVRGDAIGALRTIRAAGSLSPRALEPEELSIESHALRALGRDVEAAEVDAALRARYPEHALSR